MAASKLQPVGENIPHMMSVTVKQKDELLHDFFLHINRV
jgi:hypothetical protein